MSWTSRPLNVDFRLERLSGGRLEIIAVAAAVGRVTVCKLKIVFAAVLH